MAWKSWTSTTSCTARWPNSSVAPWLKPRLTPAPASQAVKPGGVVVAALGALLEGRHPAELGGPDDERVVEQAAGLEVDEQGGGGAVEDRAVAVVVGLDPPVPVPVEHAFAHREGAVEHGDEADPAFDQPAGEQAVAAEGGGDRVRVVGGVERVGRAGLAREVADLRGAELHPGGQLVGGDPRRELGVAGVAPQVVVVQQRGGSRGPRGRRARRQAGGAVEVGDRAVGVERGPLADGRQEPARPVRRPLLRAAARVGDRDERGQVLVRRPERVRRPGAEAGEALGGEPRAHEHLARPVRVRLRRHRVDEAHLVGQLRQVREQVGDHLARLAPRAGTPRGFWRGCRSPPGT